MNTFQIVILSIFGVFILFGLVAFATFKSGNSTALPTVTVWGTLPSEQFNDAVTNVNSTASTKINVRYVQEQADSFNQDLIEALADGDGPDIIILPQDLILQYEDKIYPLPYTSYSLSTFENTYIDEARLYTTSTGIIAFPFTVDPLVMYWNRDLLASAGIATPPQYWDDFSALVPKLTVKDAAGTITQSAVALGEYSNITDARAILSSMFLQVGNQIVEPVTNTSGGPAFASILANDTEGSASSETANNFDGTSTIADDNGDVDTASESVLRFYTEFSDPSKSTYSWNSALPSSQDAFLAGNLAIYFGFASELPTLQTENPNLNFDAAPLPQLQGSQTKTTFGEMDGFAVLKASPTISADFQTIALLTSPAFVAQFTNGTGLVSALRSVVGAPPANDADSAVFYSSALVSKGWLDPDPDDTDTIFGTMIESVISGTARLSDALQTASDNLQSVILTSVK